MQVDIENTSPPRAGDRVMHDETRKEGVITLSPDNSASRVLVLFDGAKHPIPVHPGSLEFVVRAA